jgi:hypothetical protein
MKNLHTDENVLVVDEFRFLETDRLITLSNIPYELGKYCIQTTPYEITSCDEPVVKAIDLEKLKKRISCDSVKKINVDNLRKLSSQFLNAMAFTLDAGKKSWLWHIQ